MSTIKAKPNRPTKNANGTAKALSYNAHRYNSALNNFRDDSVLSSNISKGSDISTGFYDKQQNPINKNNMLFYGIDQKIAGQSSTSLLKGAPRIPRVEPDPDYIMFMPVDISEIPALLSVQSLKDMVKNYTNSVSILAENPCPGGQSNNWIIVTPTSIDLSPPCGCYVNTNLGLLDIIPWTKVMKILKLGSRFASWILEQLLRGDSLFQGFKAEVRHFLRLGETLQGAIDDFIDRIMGGRRFAAPNLPEGAPLSSSGAMEWNDLVITLQNLELDLNDAHRLYDDIPGFGQQGLIPLDRLDGYQLAPEILAMDDGLGFIRRGDPNSRGALIDYYADQYPNLTPYQLGEMADDFLENFDFDNFLNSLQNVAHQKMHNILNDALEVQNTLLSHMNDARQTASNSATYNQGLADAREAVLKGEADRLAKNPNSQTWWAGFWGTLGLALFSVGRQKECIGPGTVLNEDTCECVCSNPNYEICPATQNPVVDFIADNLLPLTPKPEEMVGCGPRCCGGQAKYQFGGDPCACACLGDITFGTVIAGGGAQDDYWKQGSGCECLQHGLIFSTRGKCVSAFSEQRSTALGQQWSGDKCDFICPNTGTTEGQKCGGYARRKKITWTDSQGNTWPNQSSLCECECVEPDDWTGPWPPACGAGYVWNGDPTVCNCIDICSTGVCVWVVTAYGCGNIDDCTDDEGNPIDDCEYNQAYFTSEEFATEAEANAWVEANGHINTVVSMVLQGTTTASGDIDTCP